jgi:extracellular factor (EF) 3-hydroxypalmitic acid methyl ester biosynthesis protein
MGKTHSSKKESGTTNAPSGPKGPSDNKGLFRQTRFINETETLFISIEGKTGRLKNWSRTGIGFEIEGTKALYTEHQKIPTVTIQSGSLELFSGDIEVKSVKPIPNGFYYGASFTNNLFLVEGVESATAVNQTLQAALETRKEFAILNPQFCQSVVTLSSVLRIIQKTCNEEEARWKGLTFDQRCEAERVFLPNMSLQIRDLLMRFNQEIATHVDIESLPENSIYHRVFHEEIYPYFEQADIARRSYEKPRGYAGDYEMMNQIYRNGFEGLSLFGKVLHHYTVNENSGESVKFRKPYLYGYYKKVLEKPGQKSVLSIASGPAVEFQEMVEKGTTADLDRLHVTLFDLDREALEHAQTKIFEKAVKRDVRPNVSFINASVKSFLGSATSETTFDLIYSAGLFDYLDNLTSAALVRKFYSMLKPGGTLLVGNFTRDNLTKAFLHLLGNWHLIHKTEQEMKNWATGIEGCTARIEYDRLKMIAFLVLERNAT